MLLRLERVSKRYQRGTGERVALDDVSLELERGQLIGVFGPTGAGKTTLLRIAAGLLRPDSGFVSYDGERLDEMSNAERVRLRRREIAGVWASEHLAQRLSVLDYVTMPLLVDNRDHRVAERRAREALLVCEAEQCADMELEELSDGERQRVGIARALVTEPRLVLADGPTARLSLLEQERIMVLLSSLAREAKVAVLVSDSKAETLARAEPILYLSEGKLVGPASASGQGKVYHFPGSPSRAAAADA